MKINPTEVFEASFPNHNFVFGLVENVQVEGPNEETKRILDGIYPSVIEKYSKVDFEKDDNSIAYRVVEKKIGKKRFGFPDGQISRVLQGRTISNINNFVNSYMTFELLNNLSFSAYDYDSIKKEILIDVGKGNEEIELIGGKVEVIPKGDLVLTDDIGVFYSYTFGYSNRTKITQQTKNVLFVIDAPSGVDLGIAQKSMKELCQIFKSSDVWLF